MNNKLIAQELIKLAKNINASDYTSLVGEKCQQAIKEKQREIYDIQEDIKEINRAWSKWDLRSLSRRGIIDKRLEKLTEREIEEEQGELIRQRSL